MRIVYFSEHERDKFQKLCESILGTPLYDYSILKIQAQFNLLLKDAYYNGSTNELLHCAVINPIYSHNLQIDILDENEKIVYIEFCLIGDIKHDNTFW